MKRSNREFSLSVGIVLQRTAARHAQTEPDKLWRVLTDIRAEKR
jgi:hypothetical protein